MRSGAAWCGSRRSWWLSWRRRGRSATRGCCVPRARSSRWVSGPPPAPCPQCPPCPRCPPAPSERVPVQALALQEEEKAALAGTLAGLQQSLAEATAELERQRHEATGRHEQQQVGEGGAGTPPGMAQAPPLQTPCSGVSLVAMPCCISSPPLSSCPLPIASSPVPSRARGAPGGSDICAPSRRAWLRSCTPCGHRQRPRRRPTSGRPKLSASRWWRWPSSATAPCGR